MVNHRVLDRIPTVIEVKLVVDGREIAVAPIFSDDYANCGNVFKQIRRYEDPTAAIHRHTLLTEFLSQFRLRCGNCWHGKV
jgi:hypothetical protein